MLFSAMLTYQYQCKALSVYTLSLAVISLTTPVGAYS